MYNPGSTINFREALEWSTVPVMYASMRASRGCKPRLFKPFDFFDHTGYYANDWAGTDLTRRPGKYQILTFSGVDTVPFLEGQLDHP